MPKPASRTLSTRYRTLGSGTTLMDEFVVPMPAYHGGRLVRWLWRHRRGVGVVLTVWFLWWFVGSLLWALLLFGVAVGLTVWVRSRTRAEGAGSVGDILAENRQRSTLERQWPLACRTAGLTGPERGDHPTLRRIRATGDGTFEATVQSGMIGVPVPAIQKQTVTLSEVIGCREVVVTQTAPGVATLAFHWRDPVGRQLPLADLPVAPKDTLAYGIRQDGGVATVRLTQSILIGGLTRMGKSNTVWALLADAIRQGIPVHLYVSDPKGGVELDQLEQMLGDESGLIKVRQYAKTPAETSTMLTAVEKAMNARQYWMKQNGVRKIAPDHVNPLVVTILDETLPLTDMLKKGTDSPLGRVAYTGAAAAYVVWANTQVAQVDSLGRFRDLIPQRICFATPNSQVTDAVLGQGSEAVGAKCSDIRTPGVGYSHSEGDVHPRKFRAALVTDAETKLIAMGRLPQAVMQSAETQAGEKGGKTALYRWFHADDPPGSRPAYVGIAYDPLIREAQHNDALRAFMHGSTRREVEWWPTRKDAAAAEKRAIETENPTFNVQHNGRNAHRKVDLRRIRKEKAAA